MLGGVCEEAFGDVLDYEPGRWQFPMYDLTIGEVLDFFGAHNAKPCLDWHNESGGPSAYVQINDYNLAEAFRMQVKIDWLGQKEQQERCDEDMLRAGGMAAIDSP